MNVELLLILLTWYFPNVLLIVSWQNSKFWCTQKCFTEAECKKEEYLSKSPKKLRAYRNNFWILDIMVTFCALWDLSWHKQDNFKILWVYTLRYTYWIILMSVNNCSQENDRPSYWKITTSAFDWTVPSYSEKL